MKLPISYQNGTYFVVTKETGCSKFIGDTFKADFPDTIDLKVTDYCNAGCAFCHENSTKKGTHADFHALKGFLNNFPWVGIQLAIGGGNPLAWPYLDEFLVWAQDKFICNITINGLHINRNLDRLRKFQDDNLIHGIGVSAVTTGIEYPNFKLIEDHGLKNIIGHIILKRWTSYQIKYTMHDLIERNSYKSFLSSSLMPSILFLGYKDFGRGIKYKEKMELDSYFDKSKIYLINLFRLMLKHNINIHFDNLAIEQLNLKEKIVPEIWEQMYLGDEGTRSMYIDAVKQETAISSSTLDRISWLNFKFNP
jgi:hypothetical protein